MEFNGIPLKEAAAYVVDRVPSGTTGLIAVSSTGEVVMPFNTPGMFRACANEDGYAEISIWDSPSKTNLESNTEPGPDSTNNMIDLVYADDTGMFYGMKFYNDLLMEAGPQGNVQSEVILGKNKDAFTYKQGWAFPRKVYFNRDECLLPPPDTYPFLPNSAYVNPIAISTITVSILMFTLILYRPYAAKNMLRNNYNR